MKTMKHWFGLVKQSRWVVIAAGLCLFLPQVASADYPGHYGPPSHAVRGPFGGPGYADLNRDGWVSPREARIVRREMRRERARRAHFERARAREAARAHERAWHDHDRGWR